MITRSRMTVTREGRDVEVELEGVFMPGEPDVGIGDGFEDVTATLDGAVIELTKDELSTATDCLAGAAEPYDDE